MSECKCSCGGSVNLIYSCSGAANTGLLADRVSRKLMKNTTAKMTCLAAVGAGLSGFVESAKAADKNIVIDGCPVACGKKIFDKLNLPYTHFMTTDFGVEKGKTPITDELVSEVADKIIEKSGICRKN